MRYRTNLSFNELIKHIEEIFCKIDIGEIRKARWFKNKTDDIVSLEVVDYFLFEHVWNEEYILGVIFSFVFIDSLKQEQYQELYYLPLLLSRELSDKTDILLVIEQRNYRAYVVEAIHNLRYNRALSKFFKDGRSIKTAKGGWLEGRVFSESKVSLSRSLTDLSSNSLTLLKREEIVKTYRQIRPGKNFEVEISDSLYRETDFRKFPQIFGSIVFHSLNGQEYSLCLLEEYVDNQGDLWSYSQEFLRKFLLYAEEEENYNSWQNYLAGFSGEIAQLGDVIAELHLALASIAKEDFRPIKPGKKEIEDWYQNVRDSIEILFGYLKVKRDQLNFSREKMERLFSLEDRLYEEIKKVFALQNCFGKYIRVHGDLHLEQILRTNNNFRILDFEGEPLKNYRERRKKQSPLKDVTGMVRSFDYAAYAAYFAYIGREKRVSSEDIFFRAVKYWEYEMANSFLRGYIEKMRGVRDDLLPPVESFNQVMTLFNLEKVLYEAIYEFNNRPDWLVIPLEGIFSCLSNVEYI